jgi:PIN domain nuclease of toxin-antitoxin system
MLLDTHALLWFFDGNARVSLAARAAIDAGGRTTCVSVISFWEIAIKTRLGKLRAEPALVRSNVERLGWRVLALTASHIAVLETLPAHHRDPFDQALIAQAMAENLTLMTDDPAIRRYAVRTMPCAT